MFKYCESCKTKECKYVCTKIIFEALYNEGNYKFVGCPDKENPKDPNRKNYILSDNSHCTADIRMMNDHNEEIYLEIKRVPFAYEHKDEIGNSKSIDLIMFLISEIFETYDEYANYIRENYTIYIESGHIMEFDKTTFYIEDYIQDNFETAQNNEITLFIEEFTNYVYDNHTNLGKFIFNRSRDPIIIRFEHGLPFVKSFNTNNNTNLNNSNLNNSDMNKVNILNYLVLFNRFYFALPAINLNNKTLNMNKFLETVTSATKIVNQVIKNLEKSKNSFYGIDNNRIIIQELFYKYNNNDLFSDENDDLNGLGEIIKIKLESELQKREAEISNFKKYFDRCFLFIPISNNAVMIMDIF